MISKQLPEKEVEYFLYDKLDRLTQEFSECGITYDLNRLSYIGKNRTQSGNCRFRIQGYC